MPGGQIVLQPPPELQALLGDDLPTAAPVTPAPAHEVVAT